ncbi:peptidase [Shigella phage Buco]|uniref:Putative peptidase n=1 Tax=Shigella phage Buco TaxID=2530183 RepID=A0A482JLT0_9CAUD|nr:peptidase [Shigella phage Buco]QBP32910.1 putative peptidase [Shigella phage Buco]
MLNIRLLKQLLEMHRPSYDSNAWLHEFLDPRLPAGAQKVQDDYGNVFVLVGDSEQSDVAFTCHTDTVARRSSQPPKVKMSTSGIMYVGNPDVADCLGADDAAGIYLMLEMLEHGVHGRYCFFRDEEVGCEGSGWSAADKTGFWTGVKAMISFDRRGDGIITSQRFQECCSHTFALELAERLGRTPAHLQSGIYTDSAEFMGIIPECTNIGVGYKYEHTPDEILDIDILSSLLERVLAPGTFANLPIVRDPAQSPANRITSLSDWMQAAPVDEDPLLLARFRELSQLGMPELAQWVVSNPEAAAQYIAIYSDYGFKSELIEVGTKVVKDWGGFDSMF